MVVLLEPPRSADPPHSSGTAGARAVSTAPEALRVATDAPTSQAGRAASSPVGGSSASSRSSRAALSGFAVRQAW